MFFHHFKYKLLGVVRSKEYMFWNLLFPIILGTLFYGAFGKLYSAELTETIKVGILEGSENEREILDQLNQLEYESEKKIIDASIYTPEKANELLDSNEIAGIIKTGDKLELIVRKSDIEQSILSTIIQKYNQNFVLVSDISKVDQSKILDAVSEFNKERNNNNSVAKNKDKMDSTTQYFYNLLAMICMFATMLGLDFAINDQANTSNIGARKATAPISSFKMILSSVLVGVIVQFVSASIGLFYLRFILKIKFGDKFPYMFLILFAGVCVGVALGQLIGVSGKMKRQLKESIATGVSMFCCFLSGLMVANMRTIIEHKAPIINRINPAARITDSFYSLNMFDNYDRFYGNIVALFIIAVVLFIAAQIVARRKKYDSI